jgi:ketosteroid isomerase-like protein
MSVMVVDQWVADLFRAIDSMDAATFANAFTDDGTFRFGNGEPAVGRQQVEQSVSGFFSMLGGLSHQVTGVWSGSWEAGEVRSVEAEVTYTRKDGSLTQALPATSTLRMEGDRIKDYRIFADISPLFDERT